MSPQRHSYTLSQLRVAVSPFRAAVSSARGWGQNVTAFLCCFFFLAFSLFSSVRVPLGMSLLLMKQLLILLPWCSLIPVSYIMELARAGCAHHGAIPDSSHSNHPAAPYSLNLSMDTHGLIAVLHFSYFLYMEDCFVLP